MILPNIKQCEGEAQSFRHKILEWYDRHKRDLPWRDCGDPYKIWLSEVMLQQTTVAAVIKYFLKFTDKWPDVHALAVADNEEVMSAWAGLGYYARARNLHKCAKVVSQELGGVFPSSQEELKKLPGIGDYTSAAIVSIAFDQAAVVVDGNIERVMARYHAYSGEKRGLKDVAAYYAEGFEDRPGDYAQGLMDLGATICSPKSPACALCPIHDGCAGYKGGTPTFYPLKVAKKEKPKRFARVYWVTNDEGQVLLERRPDRGLLGGMVGLPTTEWVEDKKEAHLGCFEHAVCLNLQVLHVFTHFHLTLDIYSVENYNARNFETAFWSDLDDIHSIGFPTVFKKVVVSVSS